MEATGYFQDPAAPAWGKHPSIPIVYVSSHTVLCVMQLKLCGETNLSTIKTNKSIDK